MVRGSLRFRTWTLGGNMSSSKSLAPIMLGFLALVIASTGTAVAATGQLVNVVDPVSGTPAKVDSAGRLLTTSNTLTPVQPVPGVATRALNLDRYISMGTRPLVASTVAGQRLAVSALDITTVRNDPAGRTQFYFETWRPSSGTTCLSEPDLSMTRISSRLYGVGRPLETLHVAYPHPWVPAPPAPAGTVNCYYASAYDGNVAFGLTAQLA